MQVESKAVLKNFRYSNIPYNFLRNTLNEEWHYRLTHS